MLTLMSRFAWVFDAPKYMSRACWAYRSPGVYLDYEPGAWPEWTDDPMRVFPSWADRIGTSSEKEGTP